MLEVIFLTTSRIKLAHARYLCRNHSIYISKQKHYGISYIEPRIYNREELLSESIKDAYGRLKNTIPAIDEKFFFIEDTSVIIHALSKEREVPGVDVKYWMLENTFASIDEQLKAAGNDRRVAVRSDLVLRVPQHLERLVEERTITFTSFSRGRLTDREFEISTQPLYPWLDNQSFNKWFIPDGYNTVLSLLPIEEAEGCDFRKDAFNGMLSFLEKHGYIRKHSIKNNDVSNYSLNPAQQRNLFLPEPLVFLVCGPTCAGKSTLANYLIEQYSYYHIEASDYMHLSYYRRHGVGSSVSIGDFAEKALLDYPSIVVDQIIDDMDELNDIPLVITGFRSSKEIESFIKQYRGSGRIEVVFVNADADIRFRRCKKRKRSDNKNQKSDFDIADDQQQKMGLKDIQDKYLNNTIINDGTYKEYYQRFETRYQKDLINFKSPLNLDNHSYKKNYDLEDQIILSLLIKHDKEEFFTTTQIAKLINKEFYSGENEKSKNNVSRYFNQDFHPYFDVQLIEGKKRFRLSQTGVGHAKWLLRQAVKESGL
jgi:dephospho-CoA kinase/inosine/xanthosine triphosphate pyrophosphatase family protein